MSKITFSILLVMVMLIFATVYVANSNTQLEFTEPTFTEETKITQTPEAYLELRILTEIDVNNMTPQESYDFLLEMVHISENHTLNFNNIAIMGWNFYYVWLIDDCGYSQSEYETLAYEAFGNIYVQAVEQHIPLDHFSSWLSLPVPDILCKIFSSCNIEKPIEIDFIPIDKLAEDDVIKVAKVFFENPLFQTNTNFATTILCHYSDNEASDMAWEHLIELSKSTDPILSKQTYNICVDIYRHPEIISNTDKITEITKNILKNPYYDFVKKYAFLCNDFLPRSDVDKEISELTFNTLLVLARNHDPVTNELITQIASKLHNSDYAEKLLNMTT